MATPMREIFIVDCAQCRAKVAAVEHGAVKSGGFDQERGEAHYGKRLAVGRCPKCYTLLAGEAQQVSIAGYDAEEDEWGDYVRVHPKPPKAFLSNKIPHVVRVSVAEAERVIQANANIAACAMLGRALEAVCRHQLEAPRGPDPAGAPAADPKQAPMLGEGIRKLRERGLIDDRLVDWSEQLRAFRNMAAHPAEFEISREDAEDLQVFVYAIIEYIYDLTDRYNEFKERVAKRAKT